MPRRNTQVMRQFGSCGTTNTGVGAEECTVTFTAWRKLRIRGWSFGVMGWLTGNPVVNQRLTVCAEITRATARSTNATIQHGNAMCQATGNVGGTDNVGGISAAVVHLERYLTESEADELGLLLDYGESIRIIMCTTVAVGGNAAGSLGGVFLYQEVD